MECGCWTHPHIACKQHLISPGRVHHSIEVSTMAHHVDTKTILEPLILV
jgi:hypothetical protein